MKYKNRLARVFVLVVLTFSLGLQNTDAQAIKTNQTIGQKEKANTVQHDNLNDVHPDEVMPDEQRTSEQQHTNQEALAVERKELHPDELEGKPTTEKSSEVSTNDGTTSKARTPHPDEEETTQRFTKLADDPTSIQPIDDKAVDEAKESSAENLPQMQHDGTAGSEPRPRVKRVRANTPQVGHHRDGSVRKPGDPELVEVKKIRVKTATTESNPDGSAKVKKE